MGIKKVSGGMIVYDTKDTSMKDFYIYGVCVGQYRNDILAKWALRGPVLDTEDRARRLIYRVFRVDIKSEDDVYEAIRCCKEKYNQTITEWLTTFMLDEAEHGIS